MNQDIFGVCYSLINNIKEYIAKSNVEKLEKKTLVQIIDDFFKIKLTNRIENENLETFSKLIVKSFEGTVSESVFSFFLERQFNFNKENILELLNVMKFINNYGGKTNIPISFSQSFSYPKVSIIITTYNRKEFLVEAINSLLLQDYPHIEIIIIDDNSTDGTDLLIKERYKKESKITFVKKEKNCGPGNNRREAFKIYSNGEYILFLDDDDYLVDMNYISKAVKFHIDHPDVSYVTANAFLNYTLRKQLKVSNLGLGEIVNRYEYLLNFEQNGFPKPISTLTTLFKRNSLIEMGILNMKMVNDASIYLRSLLVGNAGYIDLIVGVYRIHGNNITFHLTKEFLIENLHEKMIVRNIAVEQYNFEMEKMDEWFNYNAYKTIAYYLNNSAKNANDFKFMYKWTKENCPAIYKKLRKEFQVVLLKKTLLKFPLVGFIRQRINI